MLRRPLSGLAFCALVASCGGGGGDSSSTSPSVTSVALVDGNGQTTRVGQAVSVSPGVKVTKNGSPVSNVAVTFTVTGGGGSVTGGTTTTGSDGIARVGGWTLGTTAGTNSLSASVSGASGSPVTFTATGTPGPAIAVSKAAGDAVSSAAGVAVATKPAVKVSDTFGNGVSGVSVTFAAGTGGGSVTGATATTGSDGIATVGAWTLGQTAGLNTLVATAASTGLSGNPVTFSATGIAGPAATITKLAGDNQFAGVSSAVAIAPSVKLADQFGNLISNGTVTFAVGAGGGKVTDATQTTTAGGVATAGIWTMGPAAGTNTLVATAASVTATFTATATSGAVFTPSLYAGTYLGAWTNTTFATTGPGSAQVAVSGNTITVTASASGNVLGNPAGVPNTSRSGSFLPSGASFTGTVSPMGDITGTIDVNGKIVASATNIPNPSISRWDVTGTITSSALSLAYTVTFTSGSTAVGVIELRK